MVFEQICNSKWFTQTSMILFLNKIDLFQNKLRYSSVSSYFPEFKGIAEPPFAVDYPFPMSVLNSPASICFRLTFFLFEIVLFQVVSDLQATTKITSKPPASSKRNSSA